MDRRTRSSARIAAKSGPEPPTAKQKTIAELFAPRKLPTAATSSALNPVSLQPGQAPVTLDPDVVTAPIASNLDGAGLQDTSDGVLEQSTKDIPMTVAVGPHGPVVPLLVQNPPKKVYPIFKRPTRDQPPTPAPVIEHSATLAPSPLMPETTNAPDIVPVAGPSSSPPSSQSLGSSQGTHLDPILVDSSPMKPPPAEQQLPSKPSNPLFAPRARLPPLDPIRVSPPKDVNGKQLLASYPTADTQHARGPQSAFTTSGINILRRRPPRTATELEWLMDRTPVPAPFEPSAPVESDVFHHLNGIPLSHRLLTPALARFERMSASVTSADQSYWAEKWRPMHAQECLGNEEKAIYLRDWLLALALNESPLLGDGEASGSQRGKTKRTERARPRVIRAVTRMRGRPRKRRRLDSDDEDSWIVSDTDFGSSDDESIHSSSEVAPSSDDELLLRSNPPSVPRSATSGDDSDFEVGKVDGPCEEPAPELDTPSANPPPAASANAASFRDRLTNTILLTGPPGSGKTAAVYACAEELGWEVFEVYAGIGKRSGANLDNLVGDVGKNHLVKPNPPQSKHFFAPSQTDIAANGSRLNRLKRRLADEEGTPGISPARDHHVDTGNDDPAPRAHAAVAQSIILLEEVDILFKDDANFWPSVVNLIRDCRRPVVMTCNDISVIPLGTLPIQTTLDFIPAPSPLAASYLQRLGLAEGHIISREEALNVYCSTCDTSAIDIPDMPIHPYVQPLPQHDLRRAIHNLQFHHLRPSHTKHTQDRGTDRKQEDPTKMFQRLQQLADAVSYSNSYLSRCNADISETETPDLYEPGPDDEIGHTLVRKSMDYSGMQIARPSFYAHDVVMAHEVLSQARQLLVDIHTPEASSDKLLDTRTLFEARVKYQTEMVQILDSIITINEPLLPQTSLFLDYIPWLRHMEAIEDAAELNNMAAATAAEQAGRKVRATKNSLRTERVRLLDSRQRECLDGNRLSIDWPDGPSRPL